MKYIVILGYRKYSFDNAADAVKFAELAKSHFVPDNHEDDITVEIEIILEKEES